MMIPDIQIFYDGLIFEEGPHIYYYKGKKINLSVSGLIKAFSNHFDAESISRAISIRDNRPQEDILAEWDETREESCTRGTRVHIFGEDYAYDRTLIPTCPQEYAAKKFWDELPEHIIPVKMELQMVHLKYLFAGTADILLYNTLTGKYIIADYKTNKDLFKNHKGQKLQGLFSNFLDTPFNKYQIQLSFYQILLLQQKGIEVESRKIIYLDLEGNYSMYDTEDYTKVLSKYLTYTKVC